MPGDALQLRVFESIRQKVLRPAIRLGWKPEVIAHLSVGDGGSEKQLRALLRSTVCATALRIEGCRTQVESLHAALHWSWFAGLSRFGLWGAMLILRADVELKMELPLPLPGGGHEIIVPFEALVSHVVSKRAVKRGEANHTAFVVPEVPDVCDVIIYLPRCRLEEFILASAPFASAPTLLHKMCHWSLGALAYFLPHTYNSDTTVHSNPLYRMINRVEGPTKVQWAACKASWGWTPQWCGRPANELGRTCPLRKTVQETNSVPPVLQAPTALGF
jgi:hypothetical protein